MTLSVAVLAADRLRRRCHTILAADDGLHVVADGARLTGAPELLRHHQPDVLVLDAVTCPQRALGVLPFVRAASPATGVILLGRNGTPTHLVLEGLRRGAWGHLTERDLAQQLPKAVRTVATRQAWIPRHLGAAIVGEFHAARHAWAHRSDPWLRVTRNRAHDAGLAANGLSWSRARVDHNPQT